MEEDLKIRKRVLVIVSTSVVLGLAVYLFANTSGIATKTKRAETAAPSKAQVPASWGEYTDGTNKFAIRFPPGWNILVEDRQGLKGAEGLQNEEAAIGFGDDLASFNIAIFPNHQHLAAKQWFDKDVKHAGKSWGGKWGIIAEHPITINGQKGYTALMEMPDSKDKRTYLTWGGRAYMIYYSKWWPSMTAYEQRNYKSRYAILELMLQTLRPVE